MNVSTSLSPHGTKIDKIYLNVENYILISIRNILQNLLQYVAHCRSYMQTLHNHQTSVIIQSFFFTIFI